MPTTGDVKLEEALHRAEEAIAHVRSLRGFRSVAWEDLAEELREAATHVEEVARAAKVWV